MGMSAFQAQTIHLRSKNLRSPQMSLEHIASAYDSGHSSSEGSSSSNSGQCSLSVSTCSSSKKAKLEVPREIAAMFSKGNRWLDDAEKHGGRRRAFEHEQGVWSSSFSVQTCDSECIQDIQNIVQSVAPFVKLIDPSKCHISLSRTLKCRYHWIKPLYTNVRQGLQSRKPFLVSLNRFSIYENDDCNTVFLALNTDLGSCELQDLSRRVDKALDNFRLPNYYPDPKFHISVAWVPVELKNDLQSCLQSLQNELDEYCAAVELAGVVDRLCFRSGYKVFEIPLGFEIPNVPHKKAPL